MVMVFFQCVCCFVERKYGGLEGGIEKWGWGFTFHCSSLISSIFPSITSISDYFLCLISTVVLLF